MRRYVDLSEKVTATFYDEQYEEWTEKTVTIADVLDSCCDDYTVLPSAQSTQTNTPNVLKSLDCIYRQDAIDGADEIINRDTSGNNAVVEAMKAWKVYIGNLPPAEPEERALHESCTDCPLYDTDRHSCPRFNKVIPETLRELQSAQPRMKGKWIRLEGDSRFMCSVCRWKENVPTCNGEPTIWDYCPSCGASMRGEQDG